MKFFTKYLPIIIWDFVWHYFSVKEDTLYDMVCHMDDKTGLVHQMPFTCDRQGFPAILEKVCSSRSVLSIRLVEALKNGNN